MVRIVVACSMSSGTWQAMKAKSEWMAAKRWLHVDAIFLRFA
jgi:hypothetical protein